MPLISLRQILDHAAEHDYGLPAFNVTNLETIQAVLQAADGQRAQLSFKHPRAPARSLMMSS